MTFDTGWHPDPAIVDAVLDGRATLTALNDEDRAVVVAELSERGESVEQIADRLDCCTRVVKRIRAQPLTRTLVRVRRAEAEHRAAISHARHVTVTGGTVATEQARRIEQLRGQVDSLVASTRQLRAELAEARAQTTRQGGNGRDAPILVSKSNCDTAIVGPSIMRMSNDDSGDIITRNAAAAILGVQPSTLSAWRRDNTGPASFKRGGRIVYRRRDIHRWLAHRDAATLRGDQL